MVRCRTHEVLRGEAYGDMRKGLNASTLRGNAAQYLFSMAG